MNQEYTIKYYATLREQSGFSEEKITSSAATAEALFDELAKKYHFSLKPHQLRVAINNQFAKMSVPLKQNDTIVFIPPVAGG